MTDFVDDLEQQLVAAARRRGEQRRRRLGWLPKPALPGPRRLVPVLGAVLAIAFAVAGIAAISGGDRVADDRAIGGPPVPPEEPFAFTLPYPGTFTACTDLTPGRPQGSGNGPRELLGVLRRPARPFAWKPDLRSGTTPLVPVASYRGDEVRGARRQGIDLLLVPSAGVMGEHCGEPVGQTPVPGACLVTRRGAFLATRCWKLSAIVAGRALTMAAPRDWITGIVPDGVGAVEVMRPGAKGGYMAVVKDNLFVLKVPGARRGMRLDVTMRGRGGPRVTFLNGTTRADTARAAEQALRAGGYRFRTGAIGSGPDQDLERSRVYRTARTGQAARDAVEVAGRLGIGDIYDATDGIRTLSPESQVFVVLGDDYSGWTPYAPLEEDGGGYQPPPEHKGGGQ